MAKIEQSVEINVPAQLAYRQVTRFEDYPRFMEEVESARQEDDTHVRWTTKIGEHAREWHSEIVERTPDRCIAWRNVEGPVGTGRVEVEQLGADSSRVTFSVESEAATAGEAADAMARQLGDNLQRLKQMMEGAGSTRSDDAPHQSAAGYGDVGTSDAALQASQPDGQGKVGEAGLDQAIGRAVPPSN